MSSNLQCLFSDFIQEDNVEYVKINSIFLGYLAIALIFSVLFISIYIWSKRVYKIKIYKSVNPFIVSVSLCWFLHFQPGILLSSSQSLMCSSEGDTQYALNNHYLECGDNWINNIINGLILMIFMIVVPLIILRKIQQSQKQKDNIFTMRKYGCIVLQYEEKYYFWEFISLLQKGLIIIIFNVYDGNKSIPYGLCSLVMFVYIVYLTKIKPFKSHRMNKLAIFSSIVQFISWILGISLTEEKEQDEFYQKYKNSINYINLYSNLIFFLTCFIWICIGKFYTSVSLQKQNMKRKSRNWKVLSRICLLYIKQDKRSDKMFCKLGSQYLKYLKFVQPVQKIINEKKNQIQFEKSDLIIFKQNFLKELRQYSTIQSIQQSATFNSLPTEHNGNVSFYDKEFQPTTNKIKIKNLQTMY